MLTMLIGSVMRGGCIVFLVAATWIRCMLQIATATMRGCNCFGRRQA